MAVSIGKNFKFFSLMRFAFPTVVMMIFMSLYTIIDGICISRFIGTTALSAANIAYPAYGLIIAAGVMLSAGGSAVVAKKLGEGRLGEAKDNFTFLIFIGIVLGAAFAVFGNIFIEPLVLVLGATDITVDYCISYLKVILLFAPSCILQLIFQTFFVTAGKPLIGLILTVGGGIANMVLDFLFMGPFGLGIKGAALATGIGQLIPAVIGLIYFTFARKNLCFSRFHFSLQVLFESCFNGSSEMVTHLSNAVVAFLFNIIMLKFLGESGVAAITIVLYGQFLFNAVYIGFSMGVSPVISFNYGSKNKVLLQRIFKICTFSVTLFSVVITALALVLSPYIVEVFTPKGTETYEIAKTGFFIFSFNYIFAGINIFASSMFTAFSNGKISAVISFVRTFILIVINLLLLPVIIGVNGVWLAVPIAEFTAFFLSLYFINKKKYDYCYIKEK